VTRRHILKNSLIPVVTVAGMEARSIFGAAFLIEAVFVIPGIATWSLFAVNQRDYPVLQATTMVIVLAFMMINLIVDILYTYLDPRLRVAGKEG
jgi:ABC-type dipeptide/oligopeptide/nickel transport system permease component